jgi:hypothetical protein
VRGNLRGAAQRPLSSSAALVSRDKRVKLFGDASVTRSLDGPVTRRTRTFSVERGGVEAEDWFGKKAVLFGINRSLRPDGQSAPSPSSVTTRASLTRHIKQGRGGNAPRGRGGPAKRGGGGGSSAQNSQEKPKREAILDLSKYVNTEIQITFQGGRQGTRSEISRHISLTQR